MSCSYAEGLSEYDNKGKLGLPEHFDQPDEVERKVKILADLILKSKHTVFHTGAGISTAAGIPDFRGPKGVWTLEKKGLKPEMGVSWDDARPTKSHMAIKRLCAKGLAKFVISQNIDGLHMRSGLPRANLAELHGNMFVEACQVCRKQFVRSKPAHTVGQKLLGTSCRPIPGKTRPCRGKLVDFVLDWEHELPEIDLSLSDSHSVLADLSIVVGSTLQIVPAGTMPTDVKKYNPGSGNLVIINLQPTKQDKKADLIIRCKADEVFERLFEHLDDKIPEYKESEDPTKSQEDAVIIWSQSIGMAKELEPLAKAIEQNYRLNRKRNRLKESSESSNSKDIPDGNEHIKEEIKEEENGSVETPFNIKIESLKEETGQSEVKIECT